METTVSIKNSMRTNLDGCGWPANPALNDSAPQSSTTVDMVEELSGGGEWIMKSEIMKSAEIDLKFHDFRFHNFHSKSRSRSRSEHLATMSYMLPHLDSGWAVDQAVLSEEERVVVLRFGHDDDETCMLMDEVLFSIADDVKNFAVVYLVDISEVPDFNSMFVSQVFHLVHVMFWIDLSFQQV
jgi:hypothetical protein